VLIYVQSWEPLAIKIHCLVSIHTSLNAFEFSYLEPYNKWLVATANGKVIVYNRKDFNSLSQEIFDENKPPEFNYMDNFNALDFVENNFAQTKRCNTLDHYYSMAKKNLVNNEVAEEHECEAVFSKTDLTLHLSFVRRSNQLFIRNFELHHVVKRIDFSASALPLTMALMPQAGSVPFVCVALSDNSVKLIDYMNEDNQAEIMTMHEKLTTMKVCPNGRYLLTGGNRGDVSVWKIEKKIHEPDAINDAVRE
jgi:WD40 repeat protein